MSIDNYNDLIAEFEHNRAANFLLSGNIPAGRMYGVWRAFVPAPATPTTSAALNRNSDAAINSTLKSSSETNKFSIIGGQFNTSSTAGLFLTAVDLLNQSGGLSGIVTGEQTTNLPTASLTRYTSGEGVMIGLIIYTAIGTTATTVTVRYTNSFGIPDRVSTPHTLGGTNYREASRLILIPLQPGDTGVQSVQGVTVAASTTTAGNFGIVLFKPLTCFALENTSGSVFIDAITGGMAGQLQPFNDTACLSLIATTSVAQTINGTLILGEV